MDISTYITILVMVICRQMKSYNSMPTKDKKGWYIPNKPPSHVRPIRLYSKQGYYVAIEKDGNVTLTKDEKSEDAILEMHSYNVDVKRIKRRGSNLWLSIDKKGYIKTRNKKKKDTIFREHNDGLWLWYENKDGYVLAFRKNLQPKNKIKLEDAQKKEKNKFSKFLIIDSEVEPLHV